MKNADRANFGTLLSSTMQTFNFPVTADVVGIWWGALQYHDFAAIRAAMSAHISDPEAGQWAPKPADIIGRLRAAPPSYFKALEHKSEPPPDEVLDRIKSLVDRGEGRFPWWKPERVVNQRQVDFIILQAERFGELSPAGRFMQECIEAGVIENRRIKNSQKIEHGERV